MIARVKWGSFRGHAQNAVIEVGDSEAPALITLGAVEPFAEVVGREVGAFVAGGLKAARRDALPVAVAGAVGEVIRKALDDATDRARRESEAIREERLTALRLKAFDDLASYDD